MHSFVTMTAPAFVLRSLTGERRSCGALWGSAWTYTSNRGKISAPKEKSSLGSQCWWTSNRGPLGKASQERRSPDTVAALTPGGRSPDLISNRNVAKQCCQSLFRFQYVIDCKFGKIFCKSSQMTRQNQGLHLRSIWLRTQKMRLTQ